MLEAAYECLTAVGRFFNFGHGFGFSFPHSQVPRSLESLNYGSLNPLSTWTEFVFTQTESVSLRGA